MKRKKELKCSKNEEKITINIVNEQNSNKKSKEKNVNQIMELMIKVATLLISKIIE